MMFSQSWDIRNTSDITQNTFGRQMFVAISNMESK